MLPKMLVGDFKGGAAVKTAGSGVSASSASHAERSK